MKTILHLIRFEWVYRRMRPATYIYAAIFFALGIIYLTTDAIHVSVGGEQKVNAPLNMAIYVCLMSYFGLILTQAIMAVPIFRDWEHKTDTFLFSYPMKAWEYFLGRFLGSFLVLILVTLFLPIGMAIGELIEQATSKNPGDYNPFNAWVYFGPYFVIGLTNFLLTAVLFFTLVALTRSMLASYVVAISLVVFYITAASAISDLDARKVFAQFDPFALRTLSEYTRYWSQIEKNTQFISFDGIMGINRLGWFLVSLITLGVGAWRFKLRTGLDAGKAPKAVAEKVMVPVEAMPKASVARPTYGFKLAQFWRLTVFEVRQSMGNVYFLAFLFLIAVTYGTSAYFADQSYGTGVYPVTSVMVSDVIRQGGSVFIVILLVFMAGEIVWRERQLKVEGIFDALPISSSLVFWSKFVAFLLLPALILLMVPIICIPFQLAKGVTDVELDVYFKALFFFSWPEYVLLSVLAYISHQVAGNKIQGHVFMLLYVLSAIGFDYIGFEHSLFKFGEGFSWSYSDMNGFGHFYNGNLMYLAHWTLVGIFMLGIAFLFFHRGADLGTKMRLRDAGARWKRNKALQLVTGAAFGASLATGFIIYRETVNVEHFMTRKQSEKRSVAAEKAYVHLRTYPQPKITSVWVRVDMRPENGSMTANGRYGFTNKTGKAIDTLWVSIDEDLKTKEVAISPAAKLVRHDLLNQFRGYAFEKPLQPGDTGLINYYFEGARRLFGSSSPVRRNGTFFNNGSLLNIGLNEGMFLSDNDKRIEYGLGKAPRNKDATDTNAIKNNFLGETADYVSFEAILTTAPDQIAVAPGYLQRKWTEDGRACFHYKMDIPIANFWAILSARYAVYKDKWKNVDIEIYHHKAHTYNLDKMAEALKDGLTYYSASFGPYQHKQVRILEFPRYQSFAQSFDNTIPYSEAIGFIAKFDDSTDVDYVRFVTAHELAHQWWGHQILAAGVKGSQFLSETLSEYSALMVSLKKYGELQMRKFLSYELDRYLSGRSGEKEKEQPLMEVEDQQYVFYPKGSLSTFALQDYLGEERWNAILHSYLDSMRFTGPPYPTMPYFYSHVVKNIRPEEVPFVDDHLKYITLYKNRISKATGKMLKDSTYQVTFKVELVKVHADSAGRETKQPIFAPIEVGLLVAEKGQSQKKVLSIEKLNLKNGQLVVMRSKVKPRFATIDPLYKLIDIDMADNQREIDWE